MIGSRAKLGVDVDVDSSGVGPGVDRASGKLGKLGGLAKTAGKAVAGGLALAGAAAVGFAVKSIGAASDVQQSFGALESVYGKNARQVKRWAAGAADSVGLAKSEYANLSALVGSQLQGMGVSQDASAKKSDKLIKLGADLAATYGGSVQDAVQAVSSTLKGETDPIERYGVSIKQSDVAARLAAQGQDKLTGKALKTATAHTTLKLLTEQTTKAQGAFGRETNTLAGQQQRLGAKFENLKATLGKRLLPVATRVVAWIQRMLPGAQRLGRQLSRELGPAFSAVGRFITTRVVPAAKQFYGWFSTKIAPYLKRTVNPILGGIKSAFGSMSQAIKRNKPEIDQLRRVLGNVISFVVKHVLPIIGRNIGTSFSIAGRAIGRVIDIVGGLVRQFNNAKNAVQDFIGWVGRIKIPRLPSWATGSFGGPGFGTPTLAGPTPSHRPRGRLATAAGMTDWDWATRSASVVRGAGVTMIDARTFVQVDGALDADGVAKQIERLLEARDRRLGRLRGTRR